MIVFLTTMVYFITLTKPVKLVDDILQRVCHDDFGQKKCRELKQLFTVDRQQDEAALAKRSLTSRPMSMSCRSTKAIGISFFIYQVNLREGLSVTVDCRSGIPYWLQPGTTRVFGMPPACMSDSFSRRHVIPPPGTHVNVRQPDSLERIRRNVLYT